MFFSFSSRSWVHDLVQNRCRRFNDSFTTRSSSSASKHIAAAAAAVAPITCLEAMMRAVRSPENDVRTSGAMRTRRTIGQPRKCARTLKNCDSRTKKSSVDKIFAWAKRIRVPMRWPTDAMDLSRYYQAIYFPQASRWIGRFITWRNSGWVILSSN